MNNLTKGNRVKIKRKIINYKFIIKFIQLDKKVYHIEQIKLQKILKKMIFN